jgi:hypothetical protein
MDLYLEIKKELMALWKELGGTERYLLPTVEKQIQERLRVISQLAEQIGGQLKSDAVHLKKELELFMQGELELADINLMMKDFLKLEQDTLEL